MPLKVRKKLLEHKQILNELEQVRAQEVQPFAPRFRPLGKDSQGRVYYVSTSFNSKKIPSASERANLIKWSWFLAVWGKGGTKSAETKASSDKDDNERGQEDRWWGFAEPVEIKKLAKWLEADANFGRKHKGKGNEKLEACGISKGGISSGDPISNSCGDEDRMEVDVESADRSLVTPEIDIKNLVKDLNEYADFLSWQCASATEHDQGAGKRVSTSYQGVHGAVSASRFYRAEV